MRIRGFVTVVALLCGALVGCSAETAVTPDGGGGGEIDAGRGRDAGTDAGRRDSGPRDRNPDSGPRPDAGPREPDAGPEPDVDGGPPDAGEPIDAGPLTVRRCFEDDFVTATELGPDYDQFGPTVGSHCNGTNHQDITGVERVVFLGDSVTAGSPPTLAGQFYRSRLASRIATRFGLPAPGAGWQNINLLESGIGLQQDAGPFSNCSKWGARTDDLSPEGVGDTDYQLAQCFPADRLDERTLVIMTMGGNDIAALQKDGFEGNETPAELTALWEQVDRFVFDLERSIEWLKEPGRFPNGVFVVFANMYEFTDGTGDVSSCLAADVGGFGGAWDMPDVLKSMVIHANEEFGRVAVEQQVDMIFLLEAFCGHGYHNTDPAAPCYRGPGTPQWFDLTCIHPNPTGHDQIANMFMSVIDE